MPTSKKWFCEETVPGKRFGKIRHCFLIDKLIFRGKSKYQKILIFDNSIYGRVFVLDGIVQLSERDEYIYHEMITHPILFSHQNPKRILIIGGGDGGVLKEVLKHPVKEIYLVDIDKKVIEVSKKYLPFVSRGSFQNKRAKIFIGDGIDFVKKYPLSTHSKDFFDIIIIDSNDPIGPSFPLFSEKFYKDVFSTLKKDGSMICQVGSFLDFNNLIKTIFKRIKKSFPHVQTYKLTMPSYHCGEYCFIGASKKNNLEKVDFKEIRKRFEKINKEHPFKYYSPEIHQTSMVLPKIWQLK